jgi:transposase-like protein
MGAPKLTAVEWSRRKAALDEHGGNVTAAARALGIGRGTLRDNIEYREGDGASDGFKVTHTSTLYDMETGDAKLQWVKTALDKERQEQMAREMIAGLVEGIKPAKPTPAPKTSTAALMVAYLLGDAHIGLYAWADETGEDFDTIIAKRDIVGAADRLISSTPNSDECIIVNLGDFFHMDSQANATPRSNNRLDVDTRFAQVVRVGIKIMRYMIDSALKKHRVVRVRNVAGNHDPHAGGIFIAEILHGYYANEPRVIIESSPKPFWTFRFGNNLIGITHGHGGKPDNFAGSLAVEAHADWSHCEYRYVWHGHFHTKRVIEKMGVIVECFRTLAARDAWHAENGYLAGREMQAITLHKDFGEIERHTASLKQIREASDGKKTSH